MKQTQFQTQSIFFYKTIQNLKIDKKNQQMNKKNQTKNIYFLG